MKALTPEELCDLRKVVAVFGYSDDKLDELILMVNAILSSIIDQEFGVDSVQLTLSARANYSFAVSQTPASLLRPGDSNLSADAVTGASQPGKRVKDPEP